MRDNSRGETERIAVKIKVHEDCFWNIFETIHDELSINRPITIPAL